MDGKERKGLNLPENVRKSLAAAVAERGVQARTVSTQGRSSMKPPQGHVIVAATPEEIEAIRGTASVVRQLEFYKTPFGPVVRLAFSVFPLNGGRLTGGTVLNVSQVSGDAALSGLGRQKTLFFHFYALSADGEDLEYVFSKEIPNAKEQRQEAKKVLKLARDAYADTPEDRRSFRRAVALAERQFAPPEMPEPRNGETGSEG
ncbi:Hypothetical Protein RradSPS_2351 [Rubrobacter radiotolerans]|uniref:Uncharacterized protein n=1 Tax=Rubrobacter radiotolerans TaxID=42256 RepID=A0A023X6F3_RUBRA|nr:hypothetical protein [Rubrobacter radiotolerans]AHY47634.1 Hypothetical Protein RradSPS_2351 [Rubrobacter radiotolerans]MDX5895037.1 hypothetical protein [Rubrobacter radiotolerans]SMC07321.1 conserved hypothetical protein [Rubrobacter radiotolerans DSM 5868]